MLYLVIFFIIAIIITAVLFVKINIVMEYIKNDWDDHIVVSIFTFGGIIKLKYEIPMVDLRKNGIQFKKYTEKGHKEKTTNKTSGKLGFTEMYDRFEFLKEEYQKNKAFICKVRDYMKGRFVIPELNLDVLIGVGEAHYTGVASGIAWSLYGIIISFITNTFKVLKKKVNIRSNFSRMVFNMDLFCIFSFKLVHIIVIGVKIAFYLLKIKLLTKKNSIGGGVVG